jgi:predicted enzyme related to lactoylglutathione lyase
VDDIDAASAAVEAAGNELLGQINRLPEMGYAFRHFRGPDGRVYGLNEQKAPAAA